jgi:hypothetical protein
VILDEMIGGLNMDIDAVYVHELQAILACDQSDGYLKNWANYWLEEIEHQAKLGADLTKHPVLVA